VEYEVRPWGRNQENKLRIESYYKNPGVVMGGKKAFKGTPTEHYCGGRGKGCVRNQEKTSHHGKEDGVRTALGLKPVYGGRPEGRGEKRLGIGQDHTFTSGGSERMGSSNRLHKVVKKTVGGPKKLQGGEKVTSIIENGEKKTKSVRVPLKKKIF